MTDKNRFVLTAAAVFVVLVTTSSVHPGEQGPQAMVPPSPPPPSTASEQPAPGKKRKRPRAAGPLTTPTSRAQARMAARRFAQAFTFYEISRVRARGAAGLRATATRRLAESLLADLPRPPLTGRPPERAQVLGAKVIEAGPLRGQVIVELRRGRRSRVLVLGLERSGPRWLVATLR
jgi:hypothetical protein